jgi:hypothetical protein
MKWTCPYCNHIQTVTDGKQKFLQNHVGISDQKYPSFGIGFNIIGCSNPDCSEIDVSVVVYEDIFTPKTVSYEFVKVITSDKILPKGTAKPQPNYIPAAIREDYLEACLVKNYSPKASATLSRRCLQGMIRDFCKISKSRLIDEIAALRAQVDAGTAPAGVSSESVDAIDAVRTIGNIGAHMERDVDHIIPVDPGEAQVLIDLIESLFDEWYVARQRRTERFAAIKTLAAEKAALKASPPQPALPGPSNNET